MTRVRPFHELKFPVSARQHAVLQKLVQGLAVPDRNGCNGCYEVFSQYYDSHDFRFFHDKVNGEYIKTKVRLRLYRDENRREWHSPGLEVKQRRGSLVTKFRLNLDSSQGDDCFGESSPDIRDLILANCHDSCIRDALASIQLIPVVSLHYTRTAWQFCGIDGLRLTFDTRVSSLPAGRLPLNSLPELPVCSSSPGGIFEIKSYVLPPQAVIEKLIELDIRQQSFSKYAWALQHKS